MHVFGGRPEIVDAAGPGGPKTPFHVVGRETAHRLEEISGPPGPLTHPKSTIPG